MVETPFGYHVIKVEDRRQTPMGENREGFRMQARQQAQQKAVGTYVDSLKNSSSTANELLGGVNPLAGIVHGRAILAQTVQKVVIDNMKPADAAKWGAKELESVRKEHFSLVI